LELSEPVDLDQYVQVEPICLPETYYRSKDYYKEYYSGYGRVVEGPGNARQVINLEGVAEDLECWVVGYQYAPQEELKYQKEKTSYSSETYYVPAPQPPPPPPSYGYGYHHLHHLTMLLQFLTPSMFLPIPMRLTRSTV